ncbi:hypothetical protein ACFU98_46400 [Streptomyces sp. NPDC057575]|uniref:hypothetical protein n=1 Tax=unclassified Streptomyces TaxID=2593676 RepID=UPI003686F193
MSIIIKFFVAPNDEAAATVVERGPDGVFESLVFGNFDVEEALIEWESIFTGRRFEDLVAADEPRVVADPGDGEGPLVLVASAPLQDALSAAGQPRLAEVSELWVRERAADGETFDAELATELLGGLARLARTAGGRDAGLYCWTA